MQFDDFVGQVQHRARLASTGEAMRAIHATLMTLGERLFGGEANDLAAQLPQEIGTYLRMAVQLDNFDAREFCERVQQREGVNYPDAVFHARAVMSVIRDAVSPGELRDMRDQLPADYNSLFEWGEGDQADRKAA